MLNIAGKLLVELKKRGLSDSLMWDRILPLDLSDYFLFYQGLNYPFAYETLMLNLDHHNSSIRDYILRITWICRSRLKTFDLDITQLLNNVARQLAGVDESMALIGFFSEDESEINKWIDRFEPPEPFEEQFYHRINNYDLGYLKPTQGKFYEVESKCRKLIEKTIFEECLSYSPENYG